MSRPLGAGHRAQNYQQVRPGAFSVRAALFLYLGKTKALSPAASSAKGGWHPEGATRAAPPIASPPPWLWFPGFGLGRLGRTPPRPGVADGVRRPNDNPLRASNKHTCGMYRSNHRSSQGLGMGRAPQPFAGTLASPFRSGPLPRATQLRQAHFTRTLRRGGVYNPAWRRGGLGHPEF